MWIVCDLNQNLLTRSLVKLSAQPLSGECKAILLFQLLKYPRFIRGDEFSNSSYNSAEGYDSFKFSGILFPMSPQSISQTDDRRNNELTVATTFYSEYFFNVPPGCYFLYIPLYSRWLQTASRFLFLFFFKAFLINSFVAHFDILLFHFDSLIFDS